MTTSLSTLAELVYQAIPQDERRDAVQRFASLLSGIPNAVSVTPKQAGAIFESALRAAVFSVVLERCNGNREATEKLIEEIVEQRAQ